MRRFLWVFFTFVLATPLLATEQAPERLFLNGKEFGMQYLPLYDLDTLLQRQIEKRIEVDPEHIRVLSTGLWRGYVGFWSIQDDYLYLDSIQVCIGTTDNYEYVYRYFGYEDLKELLSAYCHDGRIRADWVTRDSVRVIDYSGEMLSYAHLGFSSRFSKELFCSFRNGFLRSLSYSNHLFHDSVPLKEGREVIRERFPYDQFPEMKGRGIITYYIRDIRVDQNGRLVDCSLPLDQGSAFRDLENADTLREWILDWVRSQVLSTDWRVFEYNGDYTLGYGAQIDLFFGRKR